MSAAPILKPISESISESTSVDSFIFYQKLGADDSLLDYAKMTILFALQPEYVRLFEKCKIIKAKFKEKYPDSDWKVIIYHRDKGSCCCSYKSVFISVEYDKYNFVIFND